MRREYRGHGTMKWIRANDMSWRKADPYMHGREIIWDMRLLQMYWPLHGTRATVAGYLVGTKA